MSTRLTPLDATFLELEEADPSAHMHIGAIMVFEALPGGGVPTVGALRCHLDTRLGVLPRYSQRLSETHTGGFAWPQWQRDPRFDIARHVTRAALPAPGGERELHDWSSVFFSTRLDRRRPLWEMVLVEGLAAGRWALASKTHHCMVDGVGSVDVGHLLLDTVAAPTPPRRRQHRPATANESAAERPAPVDGGGLAALGRAWAGSGTLATLTHAAHASVHGALHPRRTLGDARAALEVIARDELHGAAHTSLNEPIGTLRRFEVVRVELEQLKRIKATLGGTINDVVLAIVAGGVAELLRSRGEPLPAQGVRAMVPMNVRDAGEHLALGNRVSSLFVELPLAGDAAARYRETVARSRALKSGGRQAAGTSAVIELAGLAPPIVHVALAQALYATRLFNITVTNVPGPQQTLYAFGAPLREIHPLVPLAASHALGVAVVSYDGEVFFGVVADRDSVADIEVLTGAMDATAAELDALAGRASAPPARVRGAPAAAHA